MPATPDVLAAYRAWNDRSSVYVEADAFAKAQVAEDFANERVLRIFNKAKINTIEGFAYSAVPIRVISSRLALLPPTVTRVGSDKPHDAAAQALDQLWEDNELAAELKAAMRHASRHGDAYVLVWPVTEQGDEEEEEPEEFEDDQDEETVGEGREARPVTGKVVGVEILVNDARSVLAVYDEESPLRMKYVIKTWVDKDSGATRINLYYPRHVEKWMCPKGGKTSDREAWIRVPGAEKDIPTPLGKIPWFHLRNGRPYGTPEHEAAYGPQRLLNKLVSSLSAVIDYQVGPQRYYMADPTIDDPNVNLTDPDYPDDDDDDPEGVGESPLSSDPGTVWKLYGRSAGQFEPANPDNLIKPLQRVIQSMAELTGIPAFHFGWGTGDTPSGAALRTLDAPTGAIVDDRKDSYGPPLARSFEHALALLGYTDVRVQVRWKPTTVITDLEGWQIMAAKIANGVPVEQCLVEAGYLPEQVSEWIASAKGADPARRIALLQAVATVIQTLGGSGGGTAQPPPAPVSPPAEPVDDQQGQPTGDDVEVSPPVPPPTSPPPTAPPGPDMAPTVEQILTILNKIIAVLPAGIEEKADAR